MSAPTFDAATFVGDLTAAGCRVMLSRPGTCFAPGDERSTYFIAPGEDGFGKVFSDVMLRWGETLEACPDHVAQTVAYLTARWEAGA